jgi:hypothetical protein
MIYRKLKFEHVIVFIIITIISSVLLWFILDFLKVQTAIEISALIALSLISGIIIYNLHGRGILPEPDTSKTLDSDVEVGRYYRKRFRTNVFSRVDYQTPVKNKRKLKSISSKIKNNQNCQYQRFKYRV